MAMLPAASLPALAQATMNCSFNSATTECGFSEQSAAGGRATLTSTARDGSTAVRLHTEPGDSNLYGSGANERDDLSLSQSATGCYQGNEQWWAHSVYFPSDYVVPPSGSTWHWGIVFDFHHTGSTGQPNFQIVSLPTGLAFWVAGGPTEVNGPNDPGFHQQAIGPVVKNTWYDFVYHIRWSSGSDGFIQASLNGQLVMNYAGPTLYAGEGCYLKLANYHTPVGQPVSVIHDRVILASTQAGLATAGTAAPPATTPPTAPPTATAFNPQRAPADFDADRKSDILWRNPATGQNTLWTMNGGTVASGPALPAQTDANWKIVGVADFNGDGKADVLWRHAGGWNQLWTMNGGTRTAALNVSAVPDANWQIVGVGDFDGDGKSDILWRNAATGDVNVWLMNGSVVVACPNVARVPDFNWVIAGVGDFDGDGKADILWRHQTLGYVNVWFMNGAKLKSVPNISRVADPTWTIVGVGDFDGNGTSDILWRKANTGEDAIMFVNGTTASPLTPFVQVADLNWMVAGVADFDGDGRADILWRNTATGENEIFFMNAGTLVSAANPPTVPVGWSVEIN